MNKKHLIFIIILILYVLTLSNFLWEYAQNNSNTKEINKVIDPVKIKKESTNTSLVIQDFKNINDKAEIKANKNGNKLIVQITQEQNENDLKANFVNIIQYTDWACKNIKNDIEILDISVLLPESKIRAILAMDKMVDNDYFDENYVKTCIEND